jgi:hypothetical protein
MGRTSVRRRGIIVAAALGLAASLAACADQAASSGSTTTPPASSSAAPASPAAGAAALPVISEGDFQTEAAALCTANGEAVGATFQAMSKPPTPEQMQAAFDTLVAESYKISDDLAALGAPQERQAALAAVIEANDRITAEVEAAGADAFFADQGDAYAELYPLMGQLGVPACLPQES